MSTKLKSTLTFIIQCYEQGYYTARSLQGLIRQNRDLNVPATLLPLHCNLNKTKNERKNTLPLSQKQHKTCHMKTQKHIASITKTHRMHHETHRMQHEKTSPVSRKNTDIVCHNIIE